MKINNRLITRVAILMAAMVSAASATVSYTTGDVLLGFRATSGTGATTNYVLNLGQSSFFTTATGSNVLNTSATGTDLAEIYGSTWYTQVGTNVTWGAVSSASNLVANGSDGAGAVYYTLPGTGTTLNNANQKTTSLAIVTFATNTSGYSTSFNGTTLASNLAEVIASSNTNSWTNNMNGGSNTAASVDFKLFNEIEGSPSTILNLYRDSSTAGAAAAPQLLGTLSLGSNGTVTFNAVPEPSSVLLGGLGTLLLITRRRRNA